MGGGSLLMRWTRRMEKVKINQGRKKRRGWLGMQNVHLKSGFGKKSPEREREREIRAPWIEKRWWACDKRDMKHETHPRCHETPSFQQLGHEGLCWTLWILSLQAPETGWLGVLIHAKSKKDKNVFVHGSLCVCFSLCLLTKYLKIHRTNSKRMHVYNWLRFGVNPIQANTAALANTKRGVTESTF